MSAPQTREEAHEAFEELLQDAMTGDAARSRVVAALAELHTARQEKSGWTKRDEKLSALVKDFLAAADERELLDGEAGVAAWIEERAGTPTFDLLSMVAAEAKAADVLLSAAAAGLIRIDNTALVRLDKNNGAVWIDLLKKYRMPGTGTSALHVGTTEEYEKAHR